MQKPFEIHKAPSMPGTTQPEPLRAERRHVRHDTAGHIRGVEASSGGLMRSTLKAGGIAAVLLVIFYLPSEYGTDLTGLGGVLGLTEMGEIKQQLYAEDAADAAALANTMVVPGELTSSLDRMEAQIAGIAAVIGADGIAPAVAPPAPVAAAPVQEAPAAEPAQPAEVVAAAEAAPAAPVLAAPDWRDEASYQLAPGEGIEVKLVMQEGQTAQFEWTANGAVVNYDTHGDGGGNSISYEQGRGVPDQAGELTAAFTGNHGWFWRNRTDAPVTLTIRTSGDYAEMKRP